MHIDPSGSNPIVTVSFGGIHFAGCKLFFKKPGDPSFKEIAKFNGSGPNEIKSRFVHTIDPIALEVPGGQVAGLVGCEVNWSILFIDFGNAQLSNYSFELTIKQETNDLLSPPYSKVGNIDDTSVVFGNKFVFS